MPYPVRSYNEGTNRTDRRDRLLSLWPTAVSPSAAVSHGSRRHDHRQLVHLSGILGGLGRGLLQTASVDEEQERHQETAAVDDRSVVD